MLTFITDNPYRTLCLYVGAGAAETVSAEGRLRAMASLGRMPDGSGVLDSVFGTPDRSTDGIGAAKSALDNRKERLRAGLFWFFRDAADSEAFDAIGHGDCEHALDLWLNGDTRAAHNRVVLLLACGRYDDAASEARTLFDSKGDELATLLCPAARFSAEDLRTEFFNTLVTEGITVRNDAASSEADAFAAPLLRRIESICSVADKDLEHDRLRGYDIGCDTFAKTAPLMEELAMASGGKDSIAYSEAAQRVANTLINCQIAAYNSGTADAASTEEAIRFLNRLEVYCHIPSVAARVCKELDTLKSNLFIASNKAALEGIEQQLTDIENNTYSIAELKRLFFSVRSEYGELFANAQADSPFRAGYTDRIGSVFYNAFLRITPLARTDAADAEFLLHNMLSLNLSPEGQQAIGQAIRQLEQEQQQVAEPDNSESDSCFSRIIWTIISIAIIIAVRSCIHSLF